MPPKQAAFIQPVQLNDPEPADIQQTKDLEEVSKVQMSEQTLVEENMPR